MYKYNKTYLQNQTYKKKRKNVAIKNRFRTCYFYLLYFFKLCNYTNFLNIIFFLKNYLLLQNSSLPFSRF